MKEEKSFFDRGSDRIVRQDIADGEDQSIRPFLVGVQYIFYSEIYD